MPDWQDHPQSAEGYLWIMKPRVVFAARVNMAAASYPIAELSFDGVTAGDWEDLEMGQTLVIGTAPGAWDLGRTYVRGDATHACATSSTISIGYSSQGRREGEVDAQDNAYITVLDLFEVCKRPSKGGSAPQSILKDYEQSPHNRHAPVVHCGNSGGMGVLDFVDGDDVLTLGFDASGSSATHPTDPGWIDQRWDVKDGTITVGDDEADAITVEFPPGYRWIKRDVIDGNINRGLPRRFCVMALEETGTNAPLRTAYRMSWTRRADGQTLTADVKERLDPADYPPGTVVMLLVKETFAGVEGSLTGWTTKFAGWLDTHAGTGKAALKDTERGTRITAVDVGGRLKALKAFPSRMERVAGLTDNSNAMAAATIWRYLWWVLFWHTSAPMLSDVALDMTAGDDYPFSLFSNGGGSFYAVGDTLAKAYGRRLTCDSRGRLQVIADPMRQEAADRTSTVQAAITEDDWTDVSRVRRRPPVGVLKGVFTPVSTTAAAALLSPPEDWHAIAPGLVEGAGSGEEQTGYPSLARDEAEGQRRLGQDYARRNAPEDLLRLTLAHGNDAGIEPALMQWVTVSASAGSIGWMDEALDAARCLPDGVTFTLDDDAGALTQAVTVERETVGTRAARDPQAGIVVTRPVLREPVLRPPPPAGFILRGGDDCLGFIVGGYLYYTLNGGVLWQRINLSATGTSLDFVSYAFSPLYRGTGNEVWLYHATSTRAALVRFNTTLLTATLTNQASYTAAGLARVETERAGLLVAIAKVIPNTQTDVIVATDGENWGTPTVLNADGASYAPPALYVSGKSDGRIYASETAQSSPAGGLVSNDSGGSFGALSSPNIDSVGGAFGLHVPFDQPGEGIAYFGYDSVPLSGSGEHRIYRANGGAQQDISPTFGGSKGGAQLQRSIDTDPNNRNLLAACLRNGTTVASQASHVLRLGYCLDGGIGGASSWHFISDLDADGSGNPLFNVRVAGDGSGVGWALGVARVVKFRFDGSYQDISGNLPAFTSPSVGIIPNLFGFGG